MIGTADFSKSMAELLNNAGYRMVPLETQEGFPKPACSIDVLNVESEREGWAWVNETYTVTVYYYPKLETTETLLRAADRLRPLLLNQALEVRGRSVDANRVAVGREGAALVLEAEYTVTQNPAVGNWDDDAELAEELYLEME